jgi:hypothetical protein
MAEILNETQYAEWDAFVPTAKGGTLFHQTWLLKPLSDDLRVVVLRDKAGRIQAGLPLTVFRFLGTAAARRVVWAAYNGPLISDSPKTNPAEKASEEKGDLLRILAESPRLGLYDYAFPPAYTDMMPLLWNGFDTSVGYTYQIPPAPPEQWQKAMTAANRNTLRKAHEVVRQLGGTVETTENFEECYALVRQTIDYKSIRHGSDVEVLSAWWKVVRDRQAGQLYVVRESSGQPICATVLAWDHRCAYYLASGIRADARKGPLRELSRLLIERMITDVHTRGLIFDFEGSSLPGVEPYFRRWGGTCLPQYRAVKIVKLLSFAAWSLHRYWTGHRKRTWFTH